MEHWFREDGEKGEWKMHFCLEHLFQFPLSPINVLRYPTPEMGVENAGEVVGGVMVRGLGFGGMVVVTRDIYI